jgi:hypothetical protein
LVTEGRGDILAVPGKRDLEGILPSEGETKLGAVETWNDAQRSCTLTGDLPEVLGAAKRMDNKDARV